MDRKKLLNALCCAAHDAAKAIMEYYHPDVQVQRKADNSPVTQADLAAHRILVAALQQLTPDIPIISEESAEHVLPQGAERFWLVDPLDGTKSFIRGKGAFTVNIGLIEHGIPTMGVIVVPTDGTCYAGDTQTGATKNDQPINVSALPDDWTAVVSMSHLDPKTEAFIKPLPIGETVSGSSSLKFCLVAEGAAQLYPRFGPTMEWDTAAGHAILLAAGGKLVQPDGSAFDYAKPDFRNGAFVAAHGECQW